MKKFDVLLSVQAPIEGKCAESVQAEADKIAEYFCDRLATGYEFQDQAVEIGGMCEWSAEILSEIR